MAPSRTSGKKGSAKPAKTTSKKSKKAVRTYKSYIHALLKKNTKHNNKMTTKGMAIVNSFVGDLFERLAGEASRLSTYSGAKTLSSKAVVAAVRLQLPKEMATHALSAGAKAVGAYSKRK